MKSILCVEESQVCEESMVCGRVSGVWKSLWCEKESQVCEESPVCDRASGE